MKQIIFLMVTATGLALTAAAQQYVSPTGPVQTGKAPAMKVKLINSSANAKTYVLVFSPGDEVRSGLTDFAKQYKVSCAHYTAVGDIVAGKAGFYNYQRKMFKVTPIDTGEVVSFTGNITLFNDEPVAHTHASFAMADGSVHGGHLLELLVGPTLEVFVTVIPAKLYKTMDSRFDSGVIDPSLDE